MNEKDKKRMEVKSPFQTKQEKKKEKNQKIERFLLSKISSHNVIQRMLHELNPTGSAFINVQAAFNSLVSLYLHPSNKNCKMQVEKDLSVECSSMAPLRKSADNLEYQREGV